MTTRPLARRAALGLLAAVTVTVAGLTMTGPALAEAKRIGVIEARREMAAGRLVLVDIRQPEEWAASGIPEGAETAAMRAKGFGARLMALHDANPDARIGLICATGARSAHVEELLRANGIDWSVDVAGGVLGPKGKGWIASGLPVVAPPR